MKHPVCYKNTTCLLLALFLFAVLSLGFAIHVKAESKTGQKLLGSFYVEFSPQTAEVHIHNRTQKRLQQLNGITLRLGFDDSIYADNVIDMVNCSDPTWNPGNQILFVHAKIVNRTDQTDQPKIISAPLELRYTGQDESNPWYVTAANTDLADAGCGATGLILDTDHDDKDANGFFDCLYPDEPLDETHYENDPGWDLSPAVGNDQMLLPGEESDCRTFLKFTLESDQGFGMTYDVLGAIRDLTDQELSEISDKRASSKGGGCGLLSDSMPLRGLAALLCLGILIWCRRKLVPLA